jgi:hypothetical protein
MIPRDRRMAFALLYMTALGPIVSSGAGRGDRPALKRAVGSFSFQRTTSSNDQRINGSTRTTINDQRGATMHVSPDHLLVAGCVGPRELPAQMIDREKVIAILRKRFPSARADEIAAAANAIVGLRVEWHEVETRVVDGRTLKIFELVE